LIACGSGTIAGFIASRIGHGDTSVNDNDHFAEVEFGDEDVKAIQHKHELEEQQHGANKVDVSPELLDQKE
jgi:hypothetical protein